MRSLLFVPGDSPRKFEKALATEADALILDLEDSVAEPNKAAARPMVAQWLRGAAGTKPMWVRINPLPGGQTLDDLAAVMPAAPFGVVVPKCEGAETLEPVYHYLEAFEAAHGLARGSTRVLAIVTETARALSRLGDYADFAGGRLWGLSWGAEDLAADVGSLANREGTLLTEPYRLVRSQCLFAAAAARVRPVDTVAVDLHDLDALLRETREAFRDGFTAKIAVHPKQIGPIHAGLEPSAEQRDWAQRVIAAFDASPGLGTLQMDGKMLDLPHLRLARRLVADRPGAPVA